MKATTNNSLTGILLIGFFISCMSVLVASGQNREGSEVDTTVLDDTTSIHSHKVGEWIARKTKLLYTGDTLFEFEKSKNSTTNPK